MSKADEAIREFAVNNGHREYFTDGDMDGFDADPRFVSDLTALISEHYYPKEFVEWAIRLGRSDFNDRYYHYISVQNPNMPFKETKELEFDDLDDAFNWWKENER